MTGADSELSSSIPAERLRVMTIANGAFLPTLASLQNLAAIEVQQRRELVSWFRQAIVELACDLVANDSPRAAYLRVADPGASSRGTSPQHVAVTLPAIGAASAPSSAPTSVRASATLGRTYEAALPMSSGVSDPRSAYTRLIESVRESVDGSIEIPWVAPGAEAWTPEDVVRQDITAERCGSCPLTTQCRAYAETAGERAGVWGGKLLGPSSEARRRSIVRGKSQEKARSRAKKRRVRGNIASEYPRTFGWESRAEAPKTLIRSDAAMNAKSTNLNACLCGCGGATRANSAPGTTPR